MTWRLRKRTTSSPLRGLDHSSQSSCPRALRVLMTSCACHSIPVWGALSAIHPVLTASLRTNKMAHVCREDPVNTYLGVRIPDGQAVTVALRPKGRCAVQTHPHPLTHTLSFSRAHHTLFSMCTPQALPTLHRGSSLWWSRCSPSYTTPPMFLPLLDGYGHGIVHLHRFYSTERWCLSAPSRRPPSAGYQASIGEHRQADGLFRPLSPSHVSPPPACLMSPPRPHRCLSLLLHALYFDSAPRPRCLGL